MFRVVKFFIVPNGNQCPHFQSNKLFAKINLCSLQIFSYVDCQELMCFHNCRVDRSQSCSQSVCSQSLFIIPWLLHVKIVSITTIVETIKLYKVTNLFLKEYHGQSIDINLSVVVERYMYSITGVFFPKFKNITLMRLFSLTIIQLIFVMMES